MLAAPASASLQAALAQAQTDSACQGDDDCTIISIDTDCTASCGSSSARAGPPPSRRPWPG